MIEYLFNYATMSSVKTVIDVIADELGATITLFSKRDGVDCKLIFSMPISNYSEDLVFYLNEFPGNCSTLILSHVESVINDYPQRAEVAVDFAYQVCKSLEYGSLMLSVITKSATLFAEERGFEVITEVYNPHSGQTSKFMKKTIERSY